MNNATNNDVAKNAKAIREALKNNCFYVYHVWDVGQGVRARIGDVRTKSGQLQVKHLGQGVWANVTDASRLIQM